MSSYHDPKTLTVCSLEGVVHRALLTPMNDLVTACEFWQTHNMVGEVVDADMNDRAITCLACMGYDLEKACSP